MPRARTHTGRNACATLLLLLFCSGIAAAQAQPDLARIVERLDRLEQENRALLEEVRALRAEVATARGGQAAPAPGTTVEQRLEIQENRIDELAQTKVASAERFPIRLSGMVLFNAFANSHQSGGTDYPTVAAAPGPGHDGATLRQTILGLDFRGPQTVWGGAVHASLYADFFGSNAFRMRTASIEIDWKTRSIMAGLEKPIFNPREPSSLAQVGISPLTGAGNLWLWIPQVRVEQDFSFGAATGLRARMGVVQTREVGPYPGGATAVNLEPARPGLEGRFEFFHKLDDRRTIEIAPGFHTSTTHAGGASIPSNLVSLDWFLNPWERLELTGAFYSGQNVALLGTGALRQGYSIENGRGEAVGSIGGWAQITLHTLPRLDFHLFSGQQDDRNSDLERGNIGKNLTFGANLYYRLAPNVLLALEASELRSVYIGMGTRVNNHYDVALGYLF
jgi:hypothetical protein